jgi:putative transposase
VKFKSHRALRGTPKQLTIIRRGKKWEALIACDIGPAPEKRVVERATGIDVGLTMLVTLSDGSEIENPRWTKHHEERIAKANRALATKKRGSKNRLKAKEALRRAHQHAANARTNYLHHVSKWLVDNYDLIAHEDLKIKNMVRSNLAKSIMDAAWAQLIAQIRYKAEEAGAYCIAVNPRGTSQRCSGCGAVVKKTLAEREHRCDCGVVLGRDHNAALNILALGRSAVGQPARA